MGCGEGASHTAKVRLDTQGLASPVATSHIAREGVQASTYALKSGGARLIVPPTITGLGRHAQTPLIVAPHAVRRQQTLTSSPPPTNTSIYVLAWRAWLYVNVCRRGRKRAGHVQAPRRMYRRHLHLLIADVLGSDNTGARPVHRLVTFCGMVERAKRRPRSGGPNSTGLAQLMKTYFRRGRVSFLETKARVARRSMGSTGVKLGLK